MIQIIAGVSGAGKSIKLHEEIIAESLKHPTKQYFIIVPEQFTMQTQKDIVMQHPCHGTMNIDIVSFNRLAYRVFGELNLTTGQVLEDFGKSMLLQLILLENKDKLKIFAGCIKKQGFIDELKSILSELFQYRISIEDIRKLVELEDENSLLGMKLQDLMLIYQNFEQKIQDHYVVAEMILDLLGEKVKQSTYLRDSEIYFDGFTGFTPNQYHLIEELNQVTQKLIFTLTIDPRTIAAKKCKEHELFYLSRKTTQRLQSIVERQHDKLEINVLSQDGAVPRYQNAPELLHMEHNLFRFPYTQYLDEGKNVVIVATTNVRQEIQMVARKIRELIKEGYRYQDIAVVSGDLASAQQAVEEIMPKLDIPYFVDCKQSMNNNACIETIKAILQICIENYSYESVFRFLKAGMTGIEEDEIELLENDVLKRGIRGKNWWIEEYTLRRSNTNIALTAQNFLKTMETFHMALSKDKTVRNYVEALYQMTLDLHLEEQLLSRQKIFEKQNNYTQARAYAQVYSKFIEVLDKLVDILGKEEMDLEDFAEILEVGLDGIELGVIPSRIDQVVIGDIERTRLNHIKILFMISVNDGVIPKNSGAAGIITETERERLSSQVELAPLGKQSIFTEQFYVYLNMTKPSEKLYLSYHSLTEDGAEARPSYLIGRIQMLFPNQKIQQYNANKLEYTTQKDNLENLIDGMRRATRGKENIAMEHERWLVLYRYYLKNNPRLVEQLEEAILYSNRDEKIAQSIAREIYGTEIWGSVSKLERYANCAYSYFLQYGLQLREREIYEVTQANLGNILHGTVERLFTYVRNSEETDWTEISKEKLHDLVYQYAEEEANQQNETIFQNSSRRRHLLAMIQEIAAYSAEQLQRQITKGKMEPQQFELSFNRSDSDQTCMNLQSANYNLEGDMHMKLDGVIDRVDICEQEDRVYVRIIDYKSSNHDIDFVKVRHGMQLQLLVYSKVILEILKRQYSDKVVIPAGAFYYHFDKPIIDAKSTTEKNEEALQKMSRMQGLINMDEPCIDLMGKDPTVLPITVKNNEVEKKDNLLTTVEFEELMDQVSDTIHKLGDDIVDGKIPMNPVEYGMLGGSCAYCSYADVCKFDGGYGGNTKRSLAAMMREDARQLSEGGDSRGLDNSATTSD